MSNFSFLCISWNRQTPDVRNQTANCTPDQNLGSALNWNHDLRNGLSTRIDLAGWVMAQSGVPLYINHWPALRSPSLLWTIHRLMPSQRKQSRDKFLWLSSSRDERLLSVGLFCSSCFDHFRPLRSTGGSHLIRRNKTELKEVQITEFQLSMQNNTRTLAGEKNTSDKLQFRIKRVRIKREAPVNNTQTRCVSATFSAIFLLFF